ncbi:MAG: nucleotidyltransferase domain-containing protein [Alphaproteobacteria bacterium]|nr:nucleotidyltransferase domain-containing protein [Alphaproteobacteria bacterium]MBN2675041.1 nucleotidyltransferase domain-containing protein [Alphaproteobacteria bacterium]
MFKIKNQKKLNQKLWLPDNSLRPEVAETLTRIYVSFMNTLSNYFGMELDIEKDVIDVILCGSSVEYFYRKTSDIDITIILRPDRYLQNMNSEIFSKILRFVKTVFIKKYSPNCYGLPVDISFEPADNYDFARYSLIQKKWLRKPTKLTCSEIKEINKKSERIFFLIRNDILSLLRNKKRYTEIPEFINDIAKKRAAAWNGNLKEYLPFGSAISHLVHDGFIQKLVNSHISFIRKLIMENKNYGENKKS